MNGSNKGNLNYEHAYAVVRIDIFQLKDKGSSLSENDLRTSFKVKQVFGGEDEALQEIERLNKLKLAQEGQVLYFLDICKGMAK